MQKSTEAGKDLSEIAHFYSASSPYAQLNSTPLINSQNKNIPQLSNSTQAFQSPYFYGAQPDFTFNFTNSDIYYALRVPQDESNISQNFNLPKYDKGILHIYTHYFSSNFENTIQIVKFLFLQINI